MSEQTNTAVIQTIYNAFNRGEIQTILSNSAQNAEWVKLWTQCSPIFREFHCPHS